MSSSRVESIRMPIGRKHKKTRTPFSWKLWIKSRADAMNSSLFLAPGIAVILGIVMAALLVTLDKQLTQHHYDLPTVMTTTVESARTVLGTVAGATISFAGIAFSVSLLVIQLGASQLSPRVVNTLFQDSFNKNVMALVVGTFTYCLVVLRSVRRALDEDDLDIAPSLSVAIAVILGILSILATVAFIDHSAHSMDVSQLLERVTRDTIAQIRTEWVEVEHATTVQVEIGHDGCLSSSPSMTKDAFSSHKNSEEDHTSDTSSINGTASHVVRFRRSGWVQEIDLTELLLCVPPNGKIHMHTIEGRYAIPGVAVCSLYGIDESIDLDELEDDILNCLHIGTHRTMRKDPAYGLRELVDVTLRALSPGVNDPTTAQDGIFHTAAIVIEFLKRNPPPHQYNTPNGGKLILGEQQDHDGIVRLAYDEARKCASTSPTVCVYLLESLRLIRESLKAEGMPYRAPEIERQARLIEEGCLRTSQVPDDHLFITQARRDRFADEEVMHQRMIPRKDDMNVDEHMTALDTNIIEISHESSQED